MASIREIEDLVAEIHRNTERAKANAKELATTTIKQEIDGDLGVVGVNGYGVLRGIRLDPRALRYADASRVGRHIVKAIRLAEKKAEQQRAERTPTGLTKPIERT